MSALKPGKALFIKPPLLSSVLSATTQSCSPKLLDFSSSGWRFNKIEQLLLWFLTAQHLLPSAFKLSRFHLFSREV